MSHLVKVHNDAFVVHFHATDVWNLILKITDAVDGRITGRRSNLHDRHSARTVVHPPGVGDFAFQPDVNYESII